MNTFEYGSYIGVILNNVMSILLKWLSGNLSEVE